MLTAFELSPGGSSTVHIYTQTVHRTTRLTTNWEECGPCPVFASYTLAFALQLRKKHGKTSLRVARRVPVGTMKTEYTEQNIHNNNKNLVIYIVFERKILRIIYGPICEEATWRSRYNEELYCLYDETDLVTSINP